MLLEMIVDLEGFKGMKSFRFTWLLPFLLCLSSVVVNTQMQGCSLQGIDFQHCLNQGQSSVSFDSCCETLNQALLAGYHCLCLLLGSANPLLTTPILLSFANCFISVPPLTQCREPLPVPYAPAFPIPVENHPPATELPVPASPAPVLIPPDIPKELPEPSANNDSFAPLPPKVDDIPLNSIPNKNSSDDAKEPTPISIPVPKLNIPEQVSLPKSGDKMIKAWFHSSLLVAVAVYAFMQ